MMLDVPGDVDLVEAVDRKKQNVLSRGLVRGDGLSSEKKCAGEPAITNDPRTRSRDRVMRCSLCNRLPEMAALPAT